MSILKALAAAAALTASLPDFGARGSADVRIRKDKRRSYITAKRRSYITAKREARARRNRRLHGGRR